jgi:hypothetical protein
LSPDGLKFALRDSLAGLNMRTSKPRRTRQVWPSLRQRGEPHWLTKKSGGMTSGDGSSRHISGLIADRARLIACLARSLASRRSRFFARHSRCRICRLVRPAVDLPSIYATTARISSSVALLFNELARLLMIRMLPFTYPRLLSKRSMLGLLRLSVPPISSLIPRTGQSSGTTMSSLVMLHSIPRRLDRLRTT